MKKSDWKSHEFLPFRDIGACLRVAAMPEDEVCRHPNTDFKIIVHETGEDFYAAYASDMFDRIKAARDAGRLFVAIFPVGPFAQYKILADVVNRRLLPMDHCRLFMMDEYAFPDGRAVPADFPFGFRNFFMNGFIGLIDAALRPLPEHIHAPGPENIDRYADMISAHGGAEVVYGGIGWSGHFAFVDPVESAWGDLDDVHRFASLGPRFCELHGITILQSSLRAFGSAYPLAPTHAYTIGPAQIRDARRRSFWCDGAPWQNFIWRLAAHGPVTPRVPASLLQLWPGELHLTRAVAGMTGPDWNKVLDFYSDLE